MARKYSNETKAAVLAALMTGQSVSSVAKEYRIPKGTVSSWWSRSGGVAELATQKEGAIGDLLLDYLQENLKALRFQAVKFQDQTWLNRQSASDAAVLHGVMTDKAVRLIEAMSNAANNTDPDS